MKKTIFIPVTSLLGTIAFAQSEKYGKAIEAIVPTSRMFVFIGAFISFGVDQNDEVINNGYKPA